MKNKAIFACVAPVSAHWQLGPLPPAAGRLVLIGWNLLGNQIDSGVPAEVGATLASALTSIAKVSFPVLEESGDAVRHLGTGGLIERVEAALKREPVNIALLSTCAPKMAVRLFEDAGYPWRLQGQVAVLSALDASPPDIDRKTLLSLIGNDWTKHTAQLRSCGIVGVIRPGVDGDIAGFLSLTEEFTQTVLEALEREARRSKFDWFWLSEDEFIEMLAA